MKRITTLIAAALVVVASQAVAVPVECSSLGTVFAMRALEPGQLLRTEVVVGPTASSTATYYRNSGPAVGGNFTLQQAMTVAAYYRCTIPGGASLGAGTAKWMHRSNSAKVHPGTEGNNRVLVSLVDTGGALDGADNSATGTIVGATPSWPHGPFGTSITALVDFSGATVGESFDVRLSSDVQAGDVSWSENLQAFALDIEVSPVGESEVDQLIDQLAAVLNIDPLVLRNLLSALAVPR
jgi:hypothetical protein